MGINAGVKLMFAMGVLHSLLPNPVQPAFYSQMHFLLHTHIVNHT
jgi:hypothetical protein